MRKQPRRQADGVDEDERGIGHRSGLVARGDRVGHRTQGSGRGAEGRGRDAQWTSDLRLYSRRALSQAVAIPSARTDRRDRLGHLDGIPPRVRLCNLGCYWEAHEIWEGLWHCALGERAGGRSTQGVDQAGAAGVKVRQGQPRGVVTHATCASGIVRSGQARSRASVPRIGP